MNLSCLDCLHVDIGTDYDDGFTEAQCLCQNWALGSREEESVCLDSLRKAFKRADTCYQYVSETDSQLRKCLLCNRLQLHVVDTKDPNPKEYRRWAIALAVACGKDYFVEKTGLSRATAVWSTNPGLFGFLRSSKFVGKKDCSDFCLNRGLAQRVMSGTTDDMYCVFWVRSYMREEHLDAYLKARKKQQNQVFTKSPIDCTKGEF